MQYSFSKYGVYPEEAGLLRKQVQTVLMWQLHYFEAAKFSVRLLGF